MLERLKSRARALKNEALAVYIAARDPRTPWYARALVFFVVAHTFSPIDLIPDFIPVIGLLDDLLIVPAGIWLVLRLLPDGLVATYREEAEGLGAKPRSMGGAALVIALWLTGLVALAAWFQA